MEAAVLIPEGGGGGSTAWLALMADSSAWMACLVITTAKTGLADDGPGSENDGDDFMTGVLGGAMFLIRLDAFNQGLRQA